MKTINRFVTTLKGNTWRLDLPAKYIVCPRCEGAGKHVNPSIDGQGLSPEDLEDPEFAEAYFSGHYDIECEECLGNRVKLVVDEDRLHPRMVQRLRLGEEMERHYEAERRMERRMGC